MTDKSSLYLDQLSPAEMLLLLSQAAQSSRGLYFEHVRLILPPTPPCTLVTLELPEISNPNQQNISTILLNAFKELTHRTPLLRRPEGESKSLTEGIAWLLLETPPTTSSPVISNKGFQILLITPEITPIDAENLFRHLLFFATSTRLSSVQSPGLGQRYLFHVQDDASRLSSFQALRASGLFNHCILLEGFEVDGLTTFLPPTTTPEEQTLRHFNHLLQVAPHLFSSRDPEATSLTAAIHHSQEKQMIEFLYLRNLPFYDAQHFARLKIRDVAFHYFDLSHSSAQLQQLEEAIHKTSPRVGYQLALRPTAYLEKNTLERLQEQKARLEYNLAYLQSIARPRPLLMRFTQSQLPALAAEIRSFPIHAILEGTIKYGFQATTQEPAGYHFLLIDPATTTRLEPDPFLLWSDLNAPHTRFRLDPFWANHYFDSTGLTQALVYVPQGFTLYPPLHAWEQTSMDQYLRQTIHLWFAASSTPPLIPARPIYLFDSLPRQQVALTILDQDHFVPLHTRLGWLNDNLVIHRTLEKEHLIEEMARDITWSEAAQTIKLDMENTRQQFDETTRTAAHNLAETTAEITELFTSEINRVVRDTFRLAEKIKRTDQRLLEWDKICTDMEETLKLLQQQWQDTQHQKTEVENQFQKMQQDIQQELDSADQRRRQMEELLEEEIKKMHLTTQKLRQRLSRVKL